MTDLIYNFISENLYSLSYTQQFAMPYAYFIFTYKMQNRMSDLEIKAITTKPRGGPLFDPTSYYYLKTLDYAPLVVNNILQGSNNYYPWNREMTTILITRRKLGFVLGQLPELADKQSEEHEAWLTCHGIIR